MFLQLKKDIELEKAGLQFISYQELQATVCEKSGSDHSSDPGPDSTAARADQDINDEGQLEETEGHKKSLEGGIGPGCEGQQQDGEEVAVSHLVENIKTSDPRRGTEVKLLGLCLGENTATVVAQQITVCLQCNR